MTICAECRHLIREGSGAHWGDYVCGAITRARGVDLVTGQETWLEGGFPAQEHPYCRNVNNGDCKLFEKKKGGKP